MTQGIDATKGDVILLVGTKKGAFILISDDSRKDWEVSNPYYPGGDFFHMVYDPRNGGALYSAVNHMIWGPEIQISHDLGQTWGNPEEPPHFSNGNGHTIKRVWHIEPGRDSDTEVLYVGVEPAALFKSEDGGKSWREIDRLTSHPTRESWQPGLGGLCLHSLVLDPSRPDRMWVGISAVGVFGTTDDGQSWQPMNKGVQADFLPERYPEFGQCPHKLLSHKARPEVLVQQNHCGVFRTDSGGEDWQDITEGLPSRFGLVLGLHSQDPDALYVLPEDKVLGTDVGGGYRVVTDARFRVYRSRNGGGDWEALTNGLPQKNAYLHTMREGMATDSPDPCGIYIGTTNGQIFYSRNDGDSWELLIDNLPPINSVECGIVV